jgi:PAS domain S-box-containing protein
VYRILRNRTLESELREIETTFGGIPPSQKEKDSVRAGLDSAAFLAYRTLEPEELFVRVFRELKKFEFESHIFFLDQEGGSAMIRHSSYNPRVLRLAESITGLNLTSFRFPLERVASFQALLEAKTPVYLPDASVLLYEILGERQLRKFIGKMTGMFRILEVVLAPITVRGEVTGVFATGRKGRLSEAYLPEVRFFSEQLSYSLENAIIFQQVKQSEGRLKNLFINLPEGVFECDRTGRILQMNPAGADILGFEGPDKPIGRSIQDFGLLTPIAQVVRKEIKKSKRTAIQNLVGVAHRTDGSPFLADITFRTEYDRSGSAVSTEGVFRDVSQRMM